MRAVVNHFARPRYGPGFEEINPQPVAAVHDMRRAYAVFAQLAQAAIRNIVFRHARYEFDRQAVIGQRNGYVRLAAAERGGERTGLSEAQAIRSRQTQHHLPESYNF